ncbi:MAG: hypothetical protein JWO09_2338 [Bacteroidetes bacterium]|nr:hypothetical protein [Bacteroidota bacterium]
MKRNRITIILVIILGALSFWFIINQRKGTIKETLRDFAVADTAAVDKIFLADKLGNAVTLERNPKGGWTVNGKYRVRMDAMKTLLETMKRVDIKEPVGKKAQDNIVKQLAADAVRCEVYSHGELVKAYYVGSQTQDMTGTYMILMDPETMKPSAKPFVTYIPGFEGYLTTRYFTEEKLWRDRTAMAYVPSEIKSVKLEAPDKPALGYELKVNGNNDYTVTMLSGQKVENIDPLAVKQYLSYFQQLNFESLDMGMTQQEIDSTLKSTPINILTVTDNAGKANRIKFFARKPKKEDMMTPEGKPVQFDLDRMNALLESTNDFVMVQYYVFGKVMPPAGYFMKKDGMAGEKPKS